MVKKNSKKRTVKNKKYKKRKSKQNSYVRKRKKSTYKRKKSPYKRKRYIGGTEPAAEPRPALTPATGMQAPPNQNPPLTTVDFSDLEARFGNLMDQSAEADAMIMEELEALASSDWGEGEREIEREKEAKAEAKAENLKEAKANARRWLAEQQRQRVHHDQLNALREAGLLTPQFNE